MTEDTKSTSIEEGEATETIDMESENRPLLAEACAEIAILQEEVLILKEQIRVMANAKARGRIKSSA